MLLRIPLRSTHCNPHRIYPKFRLLSNDMSPDLIARHYVYEITGKQRFFNCGVWAILYKHQCCRN